jgi:hypothetical protein
MSVLLTPPVQRRGSAATDYAASPPRAARAPPFSAPVSPNWLSLPPSPPPSPDRAPSTLAFSLYELSISLRKLPEVLEQIQSFHRATPLDLYSYAELLNLIEVSQNCPPDTVFYLLLIAGDMARARNAPDAKQARQLCAIIVKLLKSRTIFPSFEGEQQRARAILRELWALFRGRRGPLRCGSGRAAEEAAAGAEEATPAAEEPSAAADEEKPSFDVDEGMSARIHRGGEKYECLSPERKSQIDELAFLFVDWDHAYDMVVRVWAIMKEDPGFDVNVLVARIKWCFAEFLVRGIRVFMKEEGYDV